MASIITADNGVVSGSAGIKSSADSSGVLALATGTGTTAVTIDASQNVGVGVSPSSWAGFTGIQVGAYGALSIAGGVDDSYVGVNCYYNAGFKFANTGYAMAYRQTGGQHRWLTSTGSGSAGSTATMTQMITLDSSGNLLVNRTTALSAGQYSADFDGNSRRGIVLNNSSATTGANLISFASAGSVIANISQPSSSTVAYGTSSDYRLKENIAPMTGALSVVQQLNPVTYTWKVDGSDGQGFIAHELAEVVPDCVQGTKDAVDADGNPQYQGIDTSFLVATLTAAIQEQQALITSLTERISALEAK